MLGETHVALESGLADIYEATVLEDVVRHRMGAWQGGNNADTLCFQETAWSYI